MVLLKLPDLFFVRERDGSLSALSFVPPPGWCPAITDPYSSKLESKDVVLVSLSKDSPANAKQIKNMPNQFTVLLLLQHVNLLNSKTWHMPIRLWQQHDSMSKCL